MYNKYENNKINSKWYLDFYVPTSLQKTKNKKIICR